MEQSIQDFFLGGGNIYFFLLVTTVFFIGAVAAIIYGLYQKWHFKGAWIGNLDLLIDDLNTKGLNIANLLIDIAMTEADKNSALNIGMLKKVIEDNKDSPEFYTKLSEIIEGINDNNHITLNSDYVLAREVIKEVNFLLKNYYHKVGSFEDFANLAVDVHRYKEEIERSVLNLNGILYSLNAPKLLEETVVSLE